MTKKIDPSAVPAETGCNYPPPFDLPCNEQSSQRVTRHVGLSLFGVNLTVLAPGAWSSQRLEIGNADARDRCVYPDIDMIAEPGVRGYSHRDGTLYPTKP